MACNYFLFVLQFHQNQGKGWMDADELNFGPGLLNFLRGNCGRVSISWRQILLPTKHWTKLILYNVYVAQKKIFSHGITMNKVAITEFILTMLQFVAFRIPKSVTEGTLQLVKLAAEMFSFIFFNATAFFKIWLSTIFIYYRKGSYRASNIA